MLKQYCQKLSNSPFPIRTWHLKSEWNVRSLRHRVPQSFFAFAAPCASSAEKQLENRSELKHLRTTTDRFVSRRSYALALPKWRGHAVFPSRDLSL